MWRISAIRTVMRLCLSCCGTGETVITATDDQNHTAQCTVTVREPAAVEMGKEYTGSFKAKGESVYYRFVPQETKEYFVAATASEMLRVVILDDNGSSLDNVMYYNGKVRISEELEENEVYYIGVIADSALTGDYTLMISTASVSAGSRWRPCPTTRIIWRAFPTTTSIWRVWN